MIHKIKTVTAKQSELQKLQQLVTPYNIDVCTKTNYSSEAKHDLHLLIWYQHTMLIMTQV